MVPDWVGAVALQRIDGHFAIAACAMARQAVNAAAVRVGISNRGRRVNEAPSSVHVASVRRPGGSRKWARSQALCSVPFPVTLLGVVAGFGASARAGLAA